MKVIFLDIDGVLNGYNQWNLIGWKIVNFLNIKPLKLWYKRITEPFGVHESKVKRLAEIVQETDAVVVMSSSWRFGWWKTPYEEQYYDQKQLTDLFKKYDIDVIDITPDLGHRGKEIETWLSEHRDSIFSYIILDDENTDMSPFNKSLRFIQTSTVEDGVMIMGHYYENTGLKKKHIKEAIRLLNIRALMF